MSNIRVPYNLCITRKLISILTSIVEHCIIFGDTFSHISNIVDQMIYCILRYSISDMFHVTTAIPNHLNLTQYNRVYKYCSIF